MNDVITINEDDTSIISTSDPIILDGIYNINIKQGATFTLSFNWKDKQGRLKDLTDYSAAMKIRTDYDSATSLVSLTSGSGITLGGTAGTVICKIAPAETTTLSNDDFPAVYDFELTNTVDATIVLRLLEGKVTFDQNVTRVDV